MNTLDVLLLIRIHHAVGSRVSDIRRSVYGISLHIFAVQLSLMHRAPTAMVCASSSRPSWGKVLCGARRAVVAEMKRGALCLCLGVSINGESPKWLVYKVYNGLKGKIPLKWMIQGYHGVPLFQETSMYLPSQLFHVVRKSSVYEI